MTKCQHLSSRAKWHLAAQYEHSFKNSFVVSDWYERKLTLVGILSKLFNDILIIRSTVF
jgi:hypothetical protein